MSHKEQTVSWRATPEARSHPYWDTHPRRPPRHAAFPLPRLTLAGGQGPEGRSSSPCHVRLYRSSRPAGSSCAGVPGLLNQPDSVLRERSHLQSRSEDLGFSSNGGSLIGHGRQGAGLGLAGPKGAIAVRQGAPGRGPHPDIGQDFPAPLGLSTVPESANAPVIVSNVDAQSLAHHAIKNQPLSFNLDPFNRGLEGRADSPLTPLSPLLVRACARVESGTQDAVRQGREEGPCLGERMLLRERCGWVGRAFGFGVGPPGPDRAELRRLPPRFAPRRPGRAPCTGALPPGRPTCRPRCAGWGCTMAGPCRRRGFAIRGATLRHPSKSGYPRPTTCRPP